MNLPCLGHLMSSDVICICLAFRSQLLSASFSHDLLVPLPNFKGEIIEGGNNQPAWEKWLTDGTEQQVAKLMEEDVGAAMQFLQSKALCIMPISLASAIFRTSQPDMPRSIKPESSTPS